MNFSQIETIEDFVKAKYPAPKDGDKSYNFYKRWGYEQYLVKTFRQGLEGLCVLERAAFDQFFVAKRVADAGGADEFMAGKFLVVSKKILSGFLMPSCPKGFYGVCLDSNESGHLCLMTTKGRGQNPLLRRFGDGEIEVTELRYESPDQILDLCDGTRAAYFNEIVKQFVSHETWEPEGGRADFYYVWKVEKIHGGLAAVQLSPVSKEFCCKKKPKLKRPRKSTATIEIVGLSWLSDVAVCWDGWLDGRIAPLRVGDEGES